MYNYDRPAEIARRAFLEPLPDMFAHPLLFAAVGPVMEKMGYKQLQWPGHGTADNVSYLVSTSTAADCTKRPEVIRDVPPGKCIYWFERTGMVKAVEVPGGVAALRGNLSASMMTAGKPEEADVVVKRLVDEVWNAGGKLIPDTAFGIAGETPIENARAMFDAARKCAG